MTTLAKIIIVFVMTILLSSCQFDLNFGNGEQGNGEIVQEHREITASFTEISASEGLEVFITQSNTASIEVEADENIIDLIATNIKDGKLRIHAIENIGRATKKVYVSLPEITWLQGSSGSQLTTENTITANALEIEGSSGAQIHMLLNVEELEIDASSGANLNISGTTGSVVISASSGSNINAKKLNTNSCNADASSGANISINVSESLIADASSGANISYTGNPEVKKNKSLSGSIHRN